jgi:tRNA G46 methylase TrmB
VEAAIRALKPGGRWYIQTDHPEYFEVIRDLTGDRPELQPMDFADREGATGLPTVQTNFAIRYGQGGESIYRLAFLRRTARGESQ